MTWLDYWLLPWSLYSTLSLRVLVGASLGMLAIAASVFGREERDRRGVAADRRVGHLP